MVQWGLAKVAEISIFSDLFVLQKGFGPGSIPGQRISML